MLVQYILYVSCICSEGPGQGIRTCILTHVWTFHVLRIAYIRTVRYNSACL